MCNGKLQGTIASKFKNCLRCEFYQYVQSDNSGYGKFLGADQIIALNNGDTVHQLNSREGTADRPFTALVKIENPTTAQNLRQFLEQKSFLLIESTTMRGALECSSQAKPDILLLSVSLDDLMTSDSSDSALRQLVNTVQAPFILITESAGREIENQGFQLGALGVIHAGAANYWNELNQKIERFLRLKRRMNGLTALLIDSNPASNRTISACLQQQGITVNQARDENEAKRILLAAQPAIDLVICEAGGDSPTNGVDLCRHLRTLAPYISTPVVLLCPEKARHEVLNFFQAGATDYIMNPCPREELLARLLIHIESRQSLKELSQEVKKNKLLLDAAGEGIIGIDPNGQISFANPSGARILGYRPADLLGKNLHGLTHHTSALGEPFSPLNCPIQQSLDDGAIINVTDDIFWRSDNTSLPVKYISTPIIDEGGISGAVVTFSDITAEKREEALRQDIEQITRHDLKTPLNGIIGIPGLLLDDDNITERQRGLLELMKDSGYRMLQMINDSLNILKMEKGNYEFNPSPVDIIPLIQSALEESTILQKNGIQVRITKDGELCRKGHTFMVFGEKLLCYSMLANLIKNGFEASPEGGKIDITLTHGQPLAEIIIHNQGTLPKDIRERFFDKFTTAGKRGGTGLGTYSAKMIALTQRGTLTMTSDEALGTSLIIKIPGWSPDQPSQGVQQDE